MKTICVKSLLLMTAYIFTVHASDKQTLLFTQDEYFKMSPKRLSIIKEGLEKDILETKREAQELVYCGPDKNPCDICVGPTAVISSMVAIEKYGEFEGDEKGMIPTLIGGCFVGLAYVVSRLQMEQWYPLWATRHQRNELNKVKLALLKNASEDKDKTD